MMKKGYMISLLILIICGLIWGTPLLAKKKHPKIEGELISEDPLVCSQCHSKEYTIWEKSLHGLNNVRCYICHGDLEKRFERVASPTNCIMCHEDKVSDLKKAKGFKNCFACHNGHTLNVKPGSKNIHTGK